MEPKNKKTEVKPTPKTKTDVKQSSDKKIGFNAEKERESSNTDVRKEKITNKDERITNNDTDVTNDDDSSKKTEHQKDKNIFEPGKLPAEERKEIRKKIHHSQSDEEV